MKILPISKKNRIFQFYLTWLKLILKNKLLELKLLNSNKSLMQQLIKKEHKALSDIVKSMIV
jgi:hypothetical protein